MDVAQNKSTHVGYAGNVGLALQCFTGFGNFRIVERLEGRDWVELEGNVFAKVGKHGVDQVGGIG